MSTILFVARHHVHMILRQGSHIAGLGDGAAKRLVLFDAVVVGDFVGLVDFFHGHLVH